MNMEVYKMRKAYFGRPEASKYSPYCQHRFTAFLELEEEARELGKFNKHDTSTVHQILRVAELIFEVYFNFL